MSEAVDKGKAYFVYDGESTELHWLESANTSDDGSVSIIKGIGGVIGSVREDGGYSISLTERRPRGEKADVDWDDAKAADITFRLDIQEVGGSRYQFRGCRVSTISDDFSSGTRTRSITIVATGKKAFNF